jgi:hypothetical protein
VKHRRTEIYTLTTDVLGQSQLFLTAESWIQVKLRLETAGPVAVSTREEIVPALSGKGGLVNNDDMVFYLNLGDSLYYSAAAINRVRVIIEPVPEYDVKPVSSVEPPVPSAPAPSPAPQPKQVGRGKRRLASPSRKPRRKPTRWP